MWRTANRTKFFQTNCFIFLKIYEIVECLSDFIFVAAVAAVVVVLMWRFSRFWPQCEKIYFTRTRHKHITCMYTILWIDVQEKKSVLLLLIKLTEICLIWHKSIIFFFAGMFFSFYLYLLSLTNISRSFMQNSMRFPRTF